MIARVALPVPRAAPFDYEVPPDLAVAIGDRVRVPFGTRHMWGIVVELAHEPAFPGRLLPIEATSGPALPGSALELIAAVARQSFVGHGLALARLVPPPSRSRAREVELALSPDAAPPPMAALPSPAQARVLAAVAAGTTEVRELRKLPGGSRAVGSLLRAGTLRPRRLPFSYREEGNAITLHPRQGEAVEAIRAGIGHGRVYLLFGPPGSGKTEVYLRSAAEGRTKGTTSLLLAPEVSLLPQLWARAARVLGSPPETYFGELPPGERWRTWDGAQRGEVRCAVGTRSAAFLPLPNLGLIVLDEEGEPSYKQEEMAPYYHARTVAELRAEREGAAVVLGAAAPSVETYFRAERGEIGLLPLPDRVVGAPPAVRVAPRGDDVIGPILAEAMGRHLARGGQVLLFINRRGFYTGAACRCRAILRCPQCQIPLVFHLSERAFRCHACGRVVRDPSCPNCGETRFHLFGSGTERAEHEAKRLFPQATVARLDADTARDRDRILSSVARGEVQILVGAQMVGKGLDFPGISLVGILNADQLLSVPDFRAGERTYQLIAGAAGRAGRGERPGEVIVQSDQSDYYAIRSALAGDYTAFYMEEVKYRESLRYPPFSRLVRLIATGREAEAKAGSLAEDLARRGFEVLGPARLFPRRGVPRAQLLVRGRRDVVDLLAHALPHLPPWLRVDPDPMWLG
ncbi:MAG TPA: primosomal protein N' [Candidatus Bipolaricaulis anaerobius]|nr:primosomal protein N' [Candidatus Bipolaricaulis anaerobius]